MSEEKRSRVYRIVMVVTTLLIIIIAAYFLKKAFTENPLEGRWMNEDSGVLMTVDGSGKLIVAIPSADGDEGTVELSYLMDRDDKTITVTNEGTEYVKSDSEETDESSVNYSEISEYVSTFNYNIDGQELTLTDSEFGEQMVFYKE